MIAIGIPYGCGVWVRAAESGQDATCRVLAMEASRKIGPGHQAPYQQCIALPFITSPAICAALGPSPYRPAPCPAQPQAHCSAPYRAPELFDVPHGATLDYARCGAPYTTRRMPFTLFVRDTAFCNEV